MGNNGGGGFFVIQNKKSQNSLSEKNFVKIN